MNLFTKQCIAALLNGTLLVTQIHATLYPDTCIQFDFKSDNLVTGSIIGLDGDMDYQTSQVKWSLGRSQVRGVSRVGQGFPTAHQTTLTTAEIWSEMSRSS